MVYLVDLARTEKKKLLNKLKINVHRTGDGMDLANEREYRNRMESQVCGVWSTFYKMEVPKNEWDAGGRCTVV